MDKAFDISSIDDKLAWDSSCMLMMLVRRPLGDQALMIQCSPVGSQWMVVKTVVQSGGFEAIKGSMANQELIAIFDDLQEALGAGTAVARKWLADPSAADAK